MDGDGDSEGVCERLRIDCLRIFRIKFVFPDYFYYWSLPFDLLFLKLLQTMMIILAIIIIIIMIIKRIIIRIKIIIIANNNNNNNNCK